MTRNEPIGFGRGGYAQFSVIVILSLLLSIIPPAIALSELGESATMLAINDTMVNTTNVSIENATIVLPNATRSDIENITPALNQTEPEPNSTNNPVSPVVNLTIPGAIDPNSTIPEINLTEPTNVTTPESNATLPETNYTAPETNLTAPESNFTNNTNDSAAPPPGKIIWQFPLYANCDLTHCYIEGNISNAYAEVINFSTSDISAKDPSGNSWVDGLAKILSGGWNALKSLFGKAEGAASGVANVAKTEAARVIPQFRGKAGDFAGDLRCIFEAKNGNQKILVPKDSEITTLSELKEKGGKFARYEWDSKSGQHLQAIKRQPGVSGEGSFKYWDKLSEQWKTKREIDATGGDYHLYSGDKYPPGFVAIATTATATQQDYGPLTGLGIYFKDNNIYISADWVVDSSVYGQGRYTESTQTA